jgi:hypothetical protein
MAEISTAPAAGTFVWNELMTRDLAAVRPLFAELFGWSAEEMDMGPAGTYTVFKARGKSVAGCMEMSGPEWGSLPVHWMGYVCVEDADASVSKAEALGMKICVPPTDIPNVGRFAVIEHPATGTFSILQPTMV